MKRRRQNKPPVVKYLLMSLLILSIVVFGLIGGVFVYYQSQLQPVEKQITDKTDFHIETGESINQISSRLAEQGFIRSPLVFKIYLKQQNLGPKIQAGDFLLSSSMSLPELSQALTKASAQQVAVTLLEGWRVEEVAEYLESKLSEAQIPFDSQVFLSQPEIKEGHVFPDTYYLSLTTNEQSIAKTIEANFNQKLAPLQSGINSSQYNLNQILTMASIVEREARSDRAIVAGILWKRLENDWPLQADATLQYAKGYNRFESDWWSEPLAIDKEIESPYNTYLNTGLPPAPICNPSLSSIEAALNPTETEYWFYITAPDGTMHYSETYDQHLNNVNRYLR